MSPEDLHKLSAEQIREKYRWQKVQAPKPWYPKTPGEELVGYYGGRTLRNGSWGPYDVALIHVPVGGSFTVSGIRLIQLIDASMVQVGHPVRVIWRGNVRLDGDRTMKEFDFLVAEGPRLLPDSMVAQ